VRIVRALHPSAPIIQPAPGELFPESTADASNEWVQLDVYDAQGQTCWLDVRFYRAGSNEWRFRVRQHGGFGPSAGGCGDAELGGGTLTFDDKGRLQFVTQQVSLRTSPAGVEQPLAFDFGDPRALGGTVERGASA
jgi:hypothetical protein